MRNTLFTSIFLLVIVFISFPAHSAEKNNYSNKNASIASALPIIDCPSFVWLKPNESRDPDRTGYPNVSPGGPDCLPPIVTYSDDVLIINACHFVITRTWTATDPEDPSLFVTCEQTIKEIDEEAPIIISPPNDTMIYTNTFNCKTMVTWPQPEIYDNYLIDLIQISGENNGQTFEVENGDMFNEGITTVTYTLVDFCNNVTSYSFDVNIMCATCHVDCPDNVCLPLDSDVSPEVIGFATAYSENMNCGNADFEFEDMMIETGCNGYTKTLRIWKAVFETMPDFQYSCTQTIELKDENELILYNCPEDIVAKNNFSPVYWEEPVAVNGINSTILTSNIEPGSTFPLGITSVVYTATDMCGNETTCSFKVSVLEDASYPICPEDITTSCDGNGTALVDWEPPVYDGTCSECPRGRTIPGFIYVGSINGSNYYCSQRFYTFKEAQTLSSRYGGYITSIGSQEENTFLANHIGTASAIIGLSDIHSEGDFVWESGEDLVFERWFGSQPNDADGHQDVVEIMRNGKWNDIKTDERREFVMEVPCDYVIQLEGPSPGEELEVGDYYVLYQIADGCGLDQYCAFNITVQDGIVMSCNEDIYVEIDLTESSTIIEWDAIELSTCCSSCSTSNDCVDLNIINGSPSGSFFSRDSSTDIIYYAEDNCGNTNECRFNVTIGTKPGSKIKVDEDIPYQLIETPNVSNSINKLNKIGLDKNTNSSAVFPNPSSAVSSLYLSDYENVLEVVIYDIKGQQMIKILPSVQQFELNTSNWSNGLYQISIRRNNNNSENLRLIKI